MSTPERPDFAPLRLVADTLRPRARGVDGGSGSGDDGGMDERLRTVEQSVARIDATMPSLAQKSDIEGTKSAIEGVKTEIHRGIVETQRWMIATVIGLFVGFGGLFLAMSNALKPGPQQAQPPIIINVPGQLQGAAQGGASASGTIAPEKK